MTRLLAALLLVLALVGSMASPARGQTTICNHYGRQTICDQQQDLLVPPRRSELPWLGLGPAGYYLGYEMFGRQRDEEAKRQRDEATKRAWEQATGQTCALVNGTLLCVPAR